jgi:competence protein ComEC
LAAVPGAAVPVQLPVAGVVALYGLIGVGTWYGRLPAKRRTQLRSQLSQNSALNLSSVGLVVALLLTLAWGGSRPDGHLHVYFLNTDRGAATLIQTPSGRFVLIDGGGSATQLNAHAGRLLPFGQRQLDLLVATHPGGDYTTSLPPLFDRYRVDQLITNGTELGQSPLYNPLLDAALTAGTAVHPASAGETIRVEDGVRLEILHPGPQRHPDSHAENGVVLRLVYDEFSLLLPGAVGEWGQSQILARALPVEALVLQVGSGLVSEGWLTAVQPQIVVTNATTETESWHAPTLRLNELGTIHLTTDGQQVWLEALRR